MKNWILKQLVSRLGSVLTPIVSFIVGLLIAKLSSLNPTLAAMVDPVAVTTFVTAGLIAVANYYTNAVNSDGIKSIQAMVGAKVDGVAGPQTYIEVRRATGI